MFSTYFYSGNLLWEKPGEIKDRKPQVLYRINTSVYTQLWIVPYGFSYMDLIPVHWYVRFIPHGSSPAELEFLSRDQRVARIDALNIHINTNMTAGRATRSLKLVSASTLPRPAFCMPISIVRARFFRRPNLDRFPTRYQKTIPRILRIMTARKIHLFICRI